MQQELKFFFLQIFALNGTLYVSSYVILYWSLSIFDWTKHNCVWDILPVLGFNARFVVRSVLLIFLFSFLCCVFLFFYVLIVLFVFVRFMLCQMLRVSLDCPSLINPSVFSVVYSRAFANARRRIMLLMLGSRIHIQCIFLTSKQFFVW